LRRDATRVIYDILTLGARGASKTQIIFRANLSHKLVQKYTVFLVKKGLLSIEADLEGSRYFLTEKGGRLFHLLQEVEKELNDFYAMSLVSETRARHPRLRYHPSFDSERDHVPIEILQASSS
jgi:predicted transcriptional regulator